MIIPLITNAVIPVYLILFFLIILLISNFYFKKGSKDLNKSLSNKIATEAEIILKSQKRIKGYDLTISESKKFFIIYTDKEELKNQIIIPLSSIEMINLIDSL